MAKKGVKRLFSVDGSPDIGVFVTCTEDFVFLPAYVNEKLVRGLEEALRTKAVKVFVGESILVGLFVVGNSRGLVVTPYALDEEVEALRKETGLEVWRLPDKLSAVGAIILMNDEVALVHPELSERAVDFLKRNLKVRVYRGTVASVKNVGMAAVATNKGILAHKDASAEELEFLEEIFGLSAEVGSVNFGSPFVGAALVANSKGYAVGDETSGIELGVIESALGFV
ncbi:translation initiation factor IF-6 [Candidatus Alkanophaga liquidiphilum]|nr:Translation initiation factor 6 [Candidatus Alkanophaga liquidiphilum]RLG37959.1 MAG: translation initiation factor IF-6 [Candidatus Alkanophagales archaeon]